MELKQPDVTKVRDLIENYDNEIYRYALMYQFLVGAEPAELSGKYAPKKSNIYEVTINIRGEKYPAILFILKNIKPKDRGILRGCVIPLDPEFEPWARKLLKFFRSHGEEYPFKFHKRTINYHVADIFKNYIWPKEIYGDVGIGEKPFRIEEIRKLRIKNLKEFYFFDEIDLAIFGAWNERPKDPQKILEIENIFSLVIEENDIKTFIKLSEKYFEKLLRPISLLGKDIPPPYLIKNVADSTQRFAKAREIVKKVKDINFLCRYKIDKECEFFKENMWLPIEMFTPCERNSDEQFTHKIATLATLFEVSEKPLLNLLNEDIEGKSIIVLKKILDKKGIKYNQDMFDVWINIRNLRSKWFPIHSETELIIVDILQYFGEPPNWPPNYHSSWDNILEKFRISLIQFHDILNTYEFT